MAGDKNKRYTVVNIDTGFVGNLPGTHRLRPNLMVYELACSDGTDVVLYSDITADWFQAIRDEVGPLRVNSGHRTYSYNKSPSVNGADNSFHVLGRAMDLDCPSHLTIDKFHEICEDVCGYRSGIGKYNTFIHIDSRKGHWRG